MAELILAETSSVSTPSAAKVSFYADTTANPQLVFKDDGGTVTQLLDTRNTNIITGAKTFNNGTLLINNPAATFAYTITPAAIVAARILNLPLTTATDTLVSLGMASQTFLGAILSSGITGIGYATGAGGTVVQATSKVTAFTLSKVCGTITFAADSLAADTTSAGAVWTNTAIAATDHVVFTHVSGGTLGAYNIACTPAAGSATLFIRNLTPGALAEAPVFRFTVIKGVNA